jgi:phage tail protein X
MWWAVAEGNGQARVEQRSAAMPSLAAAAAGIAAEFQIARFALEISLPASLAVRQQALSWRLCGQEQRAAADELKGAVGTRGVGGVACNL